MRVQGSDKALSAIGSNGGKGGMQRSKQIALAGAAAGLVAGPMTAIAAPLQIGDQELKIESTVVVENYPGANQTTPFGINGAGDISGSAFVDNYSGQVGFLWHKATNAFTTIEVGSIGYTSGRGLNDVGVVVGDYGIDLTIGEFAGFAFDSTTNVVATDPNHILRGVSNAGDLTGFIPQADGTVLGFRDWQGQTDTFSCFGAPFNNAESINVAGDVVGTYQTFDGFIGAFLYRNGQCSDISIPSAIYTIAWGINDRGDIVGQYAGALWGGTCFFGAF